MVLVRGRRVTTTDSAKPQIPAAVPPPFRVTSDAWRNLQTMAADYPGTLGFIGDAHDTSHRSFAP